MEDVKEQPVAAEPATEAPPSSAPSLLFPKDEPMEYSSFLEEPEVEEEMEDGENENENENEDEEQGEEEEEGYDINFEKEDGEAGGDDSGSEGEPTW